MIEDYTLHEFVLYLNSNSIGWGAYISPVPRLNAATPGSQLSCPVADSHPPNPITLITMAVGVRLDPFPAPVEAPYSSIAAPVKPIHPQWHPHL
jgi:hypothetical protein